MIRIMTIFDVIMDQNLIESMMFKFIILIKMDKKIMGMWMMRLVKSMMVM
jgi:hypothetical protein